MKNKRILICFSVILLVTGCGNNKKQESTNEVSEVTKNTEATGTPYITPEPEITNPAEVTDTPEVSQTPDAGKEEGSQSSDQELTPTVDPANLSYADEFLQQVSNMRAFYVFSEYKNIDYQALAEKYYPMFEKADEDGDRLESMKIWRKYCAEFQDAHVSVGWKPSERDKMKGFFDKEYGLDYGFSLVTKEDGDTVFVNVDKNSEAYNAGVREGYSLISIDETPVEDAKKKETLADTDWDQTNRRFEESLYLTCDYKEEMKIAYKDGHHKTVNAVIHGKGEYADRMHETRDTLFYHGSEKKNYSYEMITKDTGVITINSLWYSKAVQEEMRLKLKDALIDLKSKGATNLILDLRENPGGYLDVCLDVASLFTDKEFLAFHGTALGHEVDIDIEDYYTRPDKVWGDGDILILVDSDTVSSAELLIHTMKQLPNVKTIGFTNSCGATGSVYMTELKDFVLTYPIMECVDEKGEVIAEKDHSGNMTMPVDIRVPLDDEAFHAVFVDKSDYVLSYAVDVLEGKRN